MRVLHAIHDFLPRHQAGSEIYALELCRALSARHHVTVVCADYDVSQRHASVRWRVHEGLPIVEIVNNWPCRSFEETYRSPSMTRRLEQVLRAVQPDVLHLHSLLNLSFDLPQLARARGIAVVATLHDYTLVCPSGGQRIHKAEQHVCRTIDIDRCARCVPQSPIYDQISFATLARATGAPGVVRRAASAFGRRLPLVADRTRRAVARAIAPVTPAQIDARLDAARRVVEHVDLFIAPSRAIAAEFERLGVPAIKLRVADYGFGPFVSPERKPAARPLRIGYVGTIVWHKGVHVLVDAVRTLSADSYELKIFGDPSVFPDYAASLLQRAEGLSVSFPGAFPHARAAEVYQAMDVLVVPSLWLENSPLVIHEAFMAGIPVVASCIGGIPDLVADGRSGILFTPGDSTALARALRSLVDDPSHVGRLAAGIPPVKHIEEDARGWDAIYQELAAEMAAPALAL